MKNRRCKSTVVLGMVCMLAGFAPATTLWNGAAGTTDWTDAANWSAGLPDGTENVYVSQGTARLATTDSGGTFGHFWIDYIIPIPFITPIEVMSIRTRYARYRVFKPSNSNPIFHQPKSYPNSKILYTTRCQYYNKKL